MPVYVDDMKVPYGRMLMSHMMADTREELYEIVDQIGVNRKWIQHKDTYREHFDICQAKKKLAIQNGAIEVTRKDLVRKMLRKKK